MDSIKKNLKKLFGLILISVSSLTLASCGTIETSELDDYNNKPTIDFIQPNLFQGKDLDYVMKHFAILKQQGYDTVILQWTCTYKDGEPYQMYYFSKQKFEFNIGYVLNYVKTAATAYNMKLIVGLQNDKNWYDQHIHGYNKDYMAALLSESRRVINELFQSKGFDGLYFSNELFTTMNGYEKQWAKHVNDIIEYIETKDEKMPLWISPFSFSNNKFSAVMWKNFFKETKFRSFDRFLLQDGFGREPKDLTLIQPSRIFAYNRLVRDYALAYSDVKFCINVELFAEFDYGTENRVKKQIDYANKLGDKIATFSYSHYYVKISE